tara:strand:- start:4390 stop:5706 length:1317 start_codon:yes stop_codon:yes gene_type:complete
MKQILDSVKKYIDEKHSKRSWEPNKDWVQYAGPYFNSDEFVNVVEVLLQEWLVLGAKGNKFEKTFPSYFDKKYGILTNSGSSSNLLMMSAMKSKRLYNLQDAKVIVPVAGFPTTVNPILQNGFKPIFVDIELDTLNIDIDNLQQIATKNPDAKILTFAHVLGNPPNMDEVMKVVKQYDLILLEDCCDALGSTYDGELLGSFGEMASCSFYPAHHITMGEGGFVATKTYEQEQVIRSFRDWGRGCYCIGKANLLRNGTCKCRFSNWIPAFPDKIFDHKYVYEEVGYNLKPIEMQAAMGLAQLDKLDDIKEKRIRNYNLLLKGFKKYEEVFLLPYPQQKSDPNWFAFPVTLQGNAPFDRTKLCEFFEDHKIQTRPYFAGNLMLQPGYSDIDPDTDYVANYPNATYAMLNTFFLGTSPVITPEKIKWVISVLDKFMDIYYN